MHTPVRVTGDRSGPAYYAAAVRGAAQEGFSAGHCGPLAPGAGLSESRRHNVLFSVTACRKEYSIDLREHTISGAAVSSAERPTRHRAECVARLFTKITQSRAGWIHLRACTFNYFRKHIDKRREGGIIREDCDASHNANQVYKGVDPR